MAGEVWDAARERLSAFAEDPSPDWAEARRLEQDAVLLGGLLAAAAPRQQGDGRRPDTVAADGVSADDVGAALSLFGEMRVRLDRLEAQVVLEARRRGMDWRRIAQHQGLNSSQAASQRYQRLMTRLEEIRQGVR
ncbi:hypothetical protein ABZ614_05680 [Streptomyces sp. NPDC013178]|uniref:hypothetical protein n=1 Tax=unclassified Streptomyces TaxID=2593676 RepID=UPI0033D1BF09